MAQPVFMFTGNRDEGPLAHYWGLVQQRRQIRQEFKENASWLRAVWKTLTPPERATIARRDRP